MLSLSNASVTRLTLHMAAMLAVSRTRPWFAEVDTAPRERAAQPNGADDAAMLSHVAPIFGALADKPATRVHKPEVDWMLLPTHYRPVP